MVRPFEKPIYVTRPFLPPLQEFKEGLEEIWETQWLTNNGPVLQRFVRALSEFFATDNICLFNNGTLALQIALQGLGVSGEIITTPFTFVATTHALFWNKIRPVFVDIEPDYYTIDPEKVEAAITPWTSAILAVHVYGYPCKVGALEDIAQRHNLKLIYDAAHAFGVKVGEHPISDFGDVSVFSFHATKLFHSVEGGMLIFRDPELKTVFDYLKNFGFKNETEVVMPGTNAKMNEIQALMGLQVLDYLDQITKRRSRITNVYHSLLSEIPGIRFVEPLSSAVTYNHAYLPIEVDKEQFGMSRDALCDRLRQYNVYARRYFYPLICDYACYRNVSLGDPLTVARRAAHCVLTLPIYDSLEEWEVERICDIITFLRARERRPVRTRQQSFGDRRVRRALP